MLNLNEIFKIGKGDTINWSFHTTMGLDIVYQAMVMGQQQIAGTDKENNEINNIREALLPEKRNEIAFFYNKASHKKLNGKGVKDIPLKNTELFAYPLECKECISGKNQSQTFHAKLSFVSYTSAKQGEKYRLIIYSKNMTFASKCLEVAGRYDIKIQRSDEQSSNNTHLENGSQLQSFLSKIYSSSNDDAKQWLKEHKLSPKQVPAEPDPAEEGVVAGDHLYNKFSNIKITDEISQQEVSLLFGGCGNGPLYKKIGLHEKLVGDESIIITPPYFVANSGDNCKNFLKGILYDIPVEKNNGEDKIWTSSHAKAYLITKGEKPEYSFLLGSANCTPRGIGWNFNVKDSKRSSLESVECLVKYELDNEKFDKLKEQIVGYYEKLTWPIMEDSGSLIPESDFWGELFANQGEVVGVEYQPDNAPTNSKTMNSNTKLKSIKYTISLEVTDKKRKKINDEINKSGNRFTFYPAEYNEECEVNFPLPQPDNQQLEIELVYKQKAKQFRFQKCQQMLVIGKSKAVLSFDGALVVDVPKPEGVCDSFNDIFLTKAMKEFGTIEGSCEYLQKQINRIGGAYEDSPKVAKVISDLECLRQIFDTGGGGK